MKTTLFCSLAGLMLVANTAQAGGALAGVGIPDNMDFYAGGSMGLSSQDGACSSLSNPITCEDSGTGYKVFAGARLKPNTPEGTLPTIGIEGGYIDFGESKAGGLASRPNADPYGKTSSNSDLSGIYAAGTAFMPVAPRVELLAKAGIMHWSQENKQATVVDSDPDPASDDRNVSSSSSDSGFGGLLGAGAQYKVTDNISVRGEYERGFGVGNNNTKTEPGLLSIGAVLSTL
jgi:opacity protein-like surface antigen